MATLCTILLVTLEHWAARGPRERGARLLAIAVVVEVEILLISALRRLWLYESAYGFTTARLYAHVYMVGVALFLGLLAWGLSRGLKAGWLARRAAAIAAVAMTVLIYWNHESWIVRQNSVASFGPSKLDTSYLVHGLSPNAVPALLRLAPSATGRQGRLGARPASAALRTDHPRRFLPLVRVESGPGPRGGRAPGGGDRGRRRSAPSSRLRRAVTDPSARRQGLHQPVQELLALVERPHRHALVAAVRAHVVESPKMPDTP